MGRDTSIVSTNPKMTGLNIRSIISAEDLKLTSKDSVRFNIKMTKTLLFDKETEARIYYD